MSEGVSSEYSGFFLQSKDMKVRLAGDSELPIGVNVSMIGCESLLVSPVINTICTGCTLPRPRSAAIASNSAANLYYSFCETTCLIEIKGSFFALEKVVD